MRKYIILLFALGLFIIPFVDGVPCSQASFCSGTSTLICDAVVSDGYCPEDYGDWSSCDKNAYGGYCNICDIDCTYCGTLGINYESLPNPSDPLTITVSVSQSATNGWIMLEDEFGAFVDSFQCTTSSCSTIFNRISPSTGGTTFQYQSYFTNFGADTFRVSGPVGRTRPLVIISDPVDNPINPEVITGAKQVVFTSSSELGIVLQKLLLEKEFPDGSGTFIPANSNSCIPGCSPANPLGTCDVIDDSGPSFIWQSFLCDNTKFRLTAYAEDSRGSVAYGEDSVVVLTNNQGAPSFSQPSKLLKLIVAKIKTWIL